MIREALVIAADERGADRRFYPVRSVLGEPSGAPLAIYGGSRSPGLHAKAEGSLLVLDGHEVDSELIGIDPVVFGAENLYFPTRLSALGREYWARAIRRFSGGSNLAGDSPDLLDAVTQRRELIASAKVSRPQTSPRTP